MVLNEKLKDLEDKLNWKSLEATLEKVDEGEVKINLSIEGRKITSAKMSIEELKELLEA